ncbi:MAG: hypothetical protein ACLP7Q_09455 [Isosphaeraceae bacterium]
MEAQAAPNRRNFLDQLEGLLKTSVGGLVIASASVAITSSQSAASTTANRNRPAITERIEELSKQLGTVVPDAEISKAGPLLAWPNWHNWRNGWPNGWHNWRNWGNWHNY